MKLTHSFFTSLKKSIASSTLMWNSIGVVNYQKSKWSWCPFNNMKIHEVNLYSNAIPVKPYCFLFLNTFSRLRIEKVLFLKKLCFSIFRISYRHFLPTDKQYQCNIMLSLLSQVGHSLPFLRLERFFYWVQMRHFYLLLFQGFKQQQKVIL